jgi:hypothetical protein
MQYSGKAMLLSTSYFLRPLLQVASRTLMMPHPLRAFDRRLVIVFFGAILFSTFGRAEQISTIPPARDSAYINPWAFNLTQYMWFPGVNGDFSAERASRSVDVSFIDISDESRRFPLGFLGRLEAHYNRLGFYLDGNYMNLQLKPRLDRLSNGLDSEMGLMDYGIAYRILGPSAAEILSSMGKMKTNWLEVYAGGRTLWLDNSIKQAGPLSDQRNFSASKSFTSPVIGGRFMVSFTPKWFVLVDGNIGGFGAQNVTLTASILGAVGYRTTLFNLPMSVEVGYKALHYNVDKGGSLETRATLNGPFIGLSGYW